MMTPKIDMETTMKTADVVFRGDLYPRLKPDPTTIQSYAENVDLLPPIEVNQDRILIDGYHRWKAHETAKRDTIRCIVTTTGSDAEIQQLAVARNARHGLQLSRADKKRYAILWWHTMPDEDVCRILSISNQQFVAWTADKRRAQEEEQKQRVYDLWMACQAQNDIAAVIGIDPAVVSRIIDGCLNADTSQVYANFDPEVYEIWNFGKSTNVVKHPGNVPPEILDNLLWYYTKPFGVVFDPFAGGGMTIDVCLARKRRYYVSDLTPVPAREQDIRRHDITTGLPDDLPVPDLVFLDPPYWAQAKGKYSQGATDLSNVKLDAFLDTIGAIARDIKRKWKDRPKQGTLALLMGPWKEGGKYLDLPFLCYKRVVKYLPLVQRIIVPYSTQVHGGAYVEAAKKNKEILYLARDLMVFGGRSDAVRSLRQAPGPEPAEGGNDDRG